MVDDKTRILIVDDEVNCLRAIKDVFDIEEIPCRTAASVRKALEILERDDFDIILTDVKMPGLSGMELLKRIKQQQPDVHVIMMTGYGSIDDAVQAMKRGAEQYIMKPVIIKDLLVLVRDILEKLDQERGTLESPLKKLAQTLPPNKIILGSSERIRNIAHLISKISNTGLPVLILGESGTGKELAANAIHYSSDRKEAPFVAINCAALPDTLLESELFGYKKGAFTDARQSKIGKFEQAHGGTLFLDEIGDMKPSMQVKLLRVLEEKEFQPLGSNTSVTADFRVIAATNKDLTQALQEGSFREDLYYRLNAVSLNMPPLREIPRDIPILATHFAQEFAKRFERKTMTLSKEVLHALQTYHWPGNARELANLIRRAVALSDGDKLQLFDFPAHISSPDIPENRKKDREGPSLKLDDMERNHILYVLELAENNKSQAATLLGIHRDTLLRKLKKYGVS